METLVAGASEMNQFAADFMASLATTLENATVIALSGDLGAGKTTFTQAAAVALGVEETVNSPTFVIEKIYALADQKWNRLIHIDAYRLKSADELKALGWEEVVADPSNLIIIEWPEHVAEAIPENAHRIQIEIPSMELGTSGEAEQRIIHYAR